MTRIKTFGVAVAGVTVAASCTLGQTGGGGRPQLPPTTAPGTPAAKPAGNGGQAATKPQTPDGGAVDLRPKFVVGRVTQYTLTTSAQTKTPGADPKDPELKSVIEENLGLRLSVVRADDGGADLELKFDRARIRITSEDIDISGESGGSPSSQKPITTAPSKGTTPGQTKPGPAKPGPASQDPIDQFGKQILDQIAQAFTQTTLKLHVDPSGRVSSVTGGEGLNALSDPSHLGLPGGGGAGVASPDALTQWIVSSCVPKASLRVGESWMCKDSLGDTPMGAIELDTTHTLRGATADRADVTVRGQVSPATGVSVGGQKPSVQASYTGSYLWDLRAGEIESQNTQLTMTVDPQKAGAAKTTCISDMHVQRVR